MIKSFTILLATFCTLASAQISDVAFKEYTYLNKGCNGFKYGEGSLIFIPNDAFCMEDGSACSGPIKIKYREFHSQTDMLVAGINMVLQRNGKDILLESAGMFELRAECNGKPMKLCADKSIQVRMKCRRNLRNLQSFIYDEKMKRWIDYGTAIDLSYNKNNPKNDDALWGSPARPSGGVVQTADPEGMEAFLETKAMMDELPDGYFQGMNIKTLGIFNYDAVIKDDNAVQMVPEFVVNTGEAIGPVVYVAYEGRNTLITYYPSDFSERFVLLNTKGIKIFTKLKDGSFATLPANYFSDKNIKLMQGTNQKFILEKQPKKPKSKQELASITKISNS